MDHDRFIGQVQDRARLDSRGSAERATRATLETVGERLDAGAAGNLAAQLPTELGEHLRRTGSGPAEQMDLQGFLTRVSEREQVDYPEAVFHARCVVEVLDEATTGSLTGKVREQLPSDFDPLFESGSTGSLRGAG